MLKVLEAVALALSLCADCFAVSACSSVGMRKAGWRRTALAALLFALVQSSFFALGWVFGDALSALVERAAHIVSFLILLFVGGAMILDAFKEKEEQTLVLDSLAGIFLGAVATSIDALAAGVSLSISGETPGVMALDASAVLVFTFIAVVLGVLSGKAAGKRFGRAAAVVGGTVLVGIGLLILFP